ncbi:MULTISPECIES: hypothetical protein [unclassified Leeuwenhoekiella]|uniref:hypothetical protein n=1 Tax=unclassified Leeuwenhoekiella TaxID=2615029 RepID=UPI00048F7457|nr:hypothetical protein [Leeuwenhoekiella sp. MAR_2009_132]
MLDFIPENLQTIIIVVVLAILFLGVVKNNKRNQRKMRDRKKRNFRAEYFDRKKEREKDDLPTN